MNDLGRKQIEVATPHGTVSLNSFCNPQEIQTYAFPPEFSRAAHHNSLYTHKESLVRDAARTEANVVVALTPEKTIVGFGVLAYPDAGERWAQLGPGRMMEVRVIEVSRTWRSGHLASRILELLLTHPAIEDIITYMVGYSWTWDLEGTGLQAQVYRQILLKLFSAFEFQELETNESNICLKQENLFMCRLGRHVPEVVVEQFNWLRFGIAPELQGTFSVQGGTSTPPTHPKRLAALLEGENLTGLGIYFDWKTQRVIYGASREWDTGLDWSSYKQGLMMDQPLMGEGTWYNHEQTRSLFDRYALGDYLDQVVALVKNRRHMGLECFRSSHGTCFFHFIHSRPPVQTGIYHARRIAGLRWYTADHDELDLITQGLRMSCAMSYKAALCRLPFGGGALAIQAPAAVLADPPVLGLMGYLLDRSRCLVYPDLGFPPDLVDVLIQNGYAGHIAGGPDSSGGSAGAQTAYGVFLAVQEAVSHHFGSRNLACKKIVVQGLGAVGFPLVADYLIPEGAEVFVADSQKTLVERLLARFPDRVHALATEEVLAFKADIFIPCAQGGLMDEAYMDQLGCAMILGGAEDILGADTEADEIRMADILADKGIFYQVDWLHNSGGAISAAAVYLSRAHDNALAISQQVERVCREAVRLNLEAARANGITPTRQAYEQWQGEIYA